MTGSPSRIIVHKATGGYRIHVAGRFGGGFSATQLGSPTDVAPFVAAQMQRYAVSNPFGGAVIAPPEILDLIPEDLRRIAGR